MTAFLFAFGAVCAFALPGPVAFFVLLAVAGLRVLWLTGDSAIEAAAEVARFPGVLAADVRRNGREVIRSIAFWTAGVSAWVAIVTAFHISF